MSGGSEEGGAGSHLVTAAALPLLVPVHGLISAQEGSTGQGDDETSALEAAAVLSERRLTQSCFSLVVSDPGPEFISL